jgi:transcriptional accessory protein Tex/SPT6
MPAAELPRQPRSPIGVCVTTSIDRRIAQELAVREEQVAAAVALLDDGTTAHVKVVEVDLARKRIALTLRLDDEVGPRADRASPRTDGGRPPATCAQGSLGYSLVGQDNPRRSRCVLSAARRRPKRRVARRHALTRRFCPC